MKHSNTLKRRVNVVLKPDLTFECVIIERSYKSHEIKMKFFLLYRNYGLFLRVTIW